MYRVASNKAAALFPFFRRVSSTLFFFFPRKLYTKIETMSRALRVCVICSVALQLRELAHESTKSRFTTMWISITDLLCFLIFRCAYIYIYCESKCVLGFKTDYRRLWMINNIFFLLLSSSDTRRCNFENCISYKYISLVPEQVERKFDCYRIDTRKYTWLKKNFRNIIIVLCWVWNYGYSFKACSIKFAIKFIEKKNLAQSGKKIVLTNTYKCQGVACISEEKCVAHENALTRCKAEIYLYIFNVYAFCKSYFL